MLDLKPYLAAHHNDYRRGRLIAISELPSEIIDLIVRILYEDSGHHLCSITGVSRTCRKLRQSTLPLMFEMTSITSHVEQQNGHDRSRWGNLDRAPVLQHAKTLCIQKPLRTNDDGSSSTGPTQDQLEDFRCDHMHEVGRTIAMMPQLQLVR